MDAWIVPLSISWEALCQLIWGPHSESAFPFWSFLNVCHLSALPSFTKWRASGGREQGFRDTACAHRCSGCGSDPLGVLYKIFMVNDCSAVDFKCLSSWFSAATGFIWTVWRQWVQFLCWFLLLVDDLTSGFWQVAYLTSFGSRFSFSSGRVALCDLVFLTLGSEKEYACLKNSVRIWHSSRHFLSLPTPSNKIWPSPCFCLGQNKLAGLLLPALQPACYFLKYIWY